MIDSATPMHTSRPSSAPDRFRFEPPRESLASEDDLDWIVSHSLGPAELASDAGAASSARLDLAARLGLLPRLASRWGAPATERELDSHPVDRLRAARARAIAHDLWLEETEADLGRIARELGIEPVLLKGRAIARGGFARGGARPAGDIDLLVPPSRLGELRRALLAAGYGEVRDRASTHHEPPLRRPQGAPVELHRHLPGLRLDGKRSATWDDLDAASLLPRSAASNPLSPLIVPSHELLVAHALVHALAQHGLTASYPGWLLIGDLIDLGAMEGPEEAPWIGWIERELTRSEIEAAILLAARANAGRIGLDAGDRPAQLARHFVACALDADYALALKTRRLDSPLSDRPRALARLALLFKALAPPIDDSPAGRAESSVRRLGRWLARPFVLISNAVRARRARRSLARRSGSGGGPRRPDTAIGALRALAQDAPLVVRVRGDCMAPAIPDGASVEIESASRYVPGEVVAFGNALDQLTLHRVIGYRLLGRRFAVLTQADSGASADSPTTPDAIVGRVRAVVRDGGLVPIGPPRRLLALRRWTAYLARGAGRRVRRALAAGPSSNGSASPGS